MRRLLRGVIRVVVIVAVTLPAIGATPSEFYLGMLRKGVGAHEGGRFEAAVSPLRIAAFGLVDSVEHYQLAQIHLALTYDRLASPDLAREAARRVVIAERIQRRYAGLPLTPATRTNFDAIARRLLTPADLAVLDRADTTTATPTPPRTTTTTSPRMEPPPVKTEPAPIKGAPEKPEPAPVKTEPVKREPAPVKSEPAKPEPAPVNTEPAKPEPAPVKTEPVKPLPAPVKTEPTPAKPEPQPTTRPVEAKPTPSRSSIPAPTPARPAIDVEERFTDAEKALGASHLVEARAIYRELLEMRSLARTNLLRLAEGFYRSRDFANALRTFERIGALRRGEEPYRYYIAVSLYETGQYARAKAELAAVLPFIEETADVTRYRVKIEGALN